MFVCIRLSVCACAVSKAVSHLICQRGVGNRARKAHIKTGQANATTTNTHPNHNSSLQHKHSLWMATLSDRCPGLSSKTTALLQSRWSAQRDANKSSTINRQQRKRTTLSCYASSFFPFGSTHIICLNEFYPNIDFVAGEVRGCVWKNC